MMQDRCSSPGRLKPGGLSPVPSLGTRPVAGRLPFVFVHDPVEPTSIEMRFKDDQRHSVGIHVNSTGMETLASGLRAEVGVEGVVGAQSVD